MAVFGLCSLPAGTPSIPPARCPPPPATSSQCSAPLHPSRLREPLLFPAKSPLLWLQKSASPICPSQYRKNCRSLDPNPPEKITAQQSRLSIRNKNSCSSSTPLHAPTLS